MSFRLAGLWWSLGALFIVIDIVMSLSPPGVGPGFLPDKVVHFATYFMLTSWFASLLERPAHRLTAVIGVILLGAVLELLQGLTPMRQPEWLDLLANTSGVALALLLVTWLPVNVFVVIERHLPGKAK